METVGGDPSRRSAQSFVKLSALAVGFLFAGLAAAWLSTGSDEALPDAPTALEPTTKRSAVAENTVLAGIEAGSVQIEPPFADPHNNSDLVAQFEALLNRNDSFRQDQLLDKLFQTWVSRDSPGAAAFVLGIEEEELRRKSLLRVAQNWAMQEPEDALKWVIGAEFETDYERKMAGCMVCTQVAREDPIEAIQLALDYGVNKEAEEILTNLTARWAELDAPAALKWAASQSAGKQRDDLVLGIATVVLNNDPVKAAKLVLQEIPPGEGQNEAVFAILRLWAFKDMAGAKAWAEVFPEGPIRNRAVAELDGIRNGQTHK